MIGMSLVITIFTAIMLIVTQDAVFMVGLSALVTLIIGLGELVNHIYQKRKKRLNEQRRAVPTEKTSILDVNRLYFYNTSSSESEHESIGSV